MIAAIKRSTETQALQRYFPGLESLWVLTEDEAKIADSECEMVIAEDEDDIRLRFERKFSAPHGCHRVVIGLSRDLGPSWRALCRLECRSDYDSSQIYVGVFEHPEADDEIELEDLMAAAMSCGTVRLTDESRHIPKELKAGELRTHDGQFYFRGCRDGAAKFVFDPARVKRLSARVAGAKLPSKPRLYDVCPKWNFKSWILDLHGVLVDVICVDELYEIGVRQGTLALGYSTRTEWAVHRLLEIVDALPALRMVKKARKAIRKMMPYGYFFLHRYGNELFSKWWYGEMKLLKLKPGVTKEKLAYERRLAKIRKEAERAKRNVARKETGSRPNHVHAVGEAGSPGGRIGTAGDKLPAPEAGTGGDRDTPQGEVSAA